MTDLLLEEDFQILKQSLPAAFRESLQNNTLALTQSYPLLSMICINREVVERLKVGLKVPPPPSGPELGKQLLMLCQELETHFNLNPLFRYELPEILSEFPIHSRAINKAIKEFNQFVKPEQKDKQVSSIMEPIENSHPVDLGECYKMIFTQIKEHGVHCNVDSLWQLLEMISGWSNASPLTLIKREDVPLVEAVAEMVPDNPQKITPIQIIDLEQPKATLSQNPLIPDYNYNYNGAGRLASETDILLLNAFGMKIGGHFDAQVKYAPRFIPLDELHALIRRQLSHRMTVSQSEAFQLWIETTLHQLGVTFIQRNEGYLSKDLLVNPFLTELISFLSPEKIQSLLNETLKDYACEDLNPKKSEIDIIAQYLFELLQGFQINPGQALGIGANWDGTVNLSNEAGAYAFKFNETEAEWGRRFKQLSLHRQGPSEAKMNAAIGIKFEIQSLLSSFDYMSQLQPSEYKEVVYNALIDNLVTDLFPEPAYFENSTYPKFRKVHVVNTSEQGSIQIDSFYQPSSLGTYFKDKEGNYKQTPMYRRAGTLDVTAFPRNTTYSEQSRVCYAGNPLGPLQLQYAQAMHRNARGHIVYNPIGPDHFLEDPFYGQVIRGDNGDYLPFIGVIPKNFDRHFKQENELCASFVIRMLQSARIMEHCPTFKKTYDQIKTSFLPLKDIPPPELPKFCADYLIEKRQQLAAELAREDRNYIDCEPQFNRLFKNLIYSLYEYARADEHFKHGFLSYIYSKETFNPMCKSKCDKIIRDLSVNRPVNVSADSLARYDEVVNYLRSITAFFYPKPSDSLAQELAQEAARYVIPLVQSTGVKQYFEQQRQNKQTNLSRKQTPGILFSSLKNDGPSKTIADDYKRMHRDNFPSYYRDPDGTPNGEPQTHDRALDWGAKKLGASLQLMHKYHPLALLHFPISETYLRAKQRVAEHDNLKVLWALRGSLEGLFWYGLVQGLWHTATTPFFMLGDLFSWQYQLLRNKKKSPLNNPLALSAAPANEPSIKSLEAARSRDFLLELLGTPGSNDSKKTSIIDYATQLAKNLYPYLSRKDSILCRQGLDNTFPLDAAELALLFKPLLMANDWEELAVILNQHSPFINKSLIQAVFRCITHPQFSTQAKTIIKETESFFGLSSKQNKALENILELYQRTPHAHQSRFLELFQFKGVLHQALLVRDQLIQKTQNHMLKVFDEQWVLDLVFAARIDKLIEILNPRLLEGTVLRLPNYMKWPLKHLLVSNNPKVLDNYPLQEKQITFLQKVHAICLHLPKEQKDKLLEMCRIEKTEDNPLLSVKDKAHRKWAKFTERELRHQLPSIEEANEIILILAKRLKKLTNVKPLFRVLKTTYPSLAQDEDLDLFFAAMKKIDHHVTQAMRQQKKINHKLSEAKALAHNFLNITMNALINSRLDAVDIFNTQQPQNPLLISKAITLWLRTLAKNNRDLRSFLEQQIHQSPSLDQGVWRCKCIMQVLEGQQPTEKIAKTGMQSLLRFWSQHKDNVTLTGDQFITPATGETDKSTNEVLLKDSVTMQHAMARVQSKLPRYSMFRVPPRKDEVMKKDKEEMSPSL